MRLALWLSPVQAAALEVDGGEEQQHPRVVGLLPPQLHAVALRRLEVARLVLTVGQLRQPLEGKHTFGRFWSTNTTREGDGRAQRMGRGRGWGGEGRTNVRRNGNNS